MGGGELACKSVPGMVKSVLQSVYIYREDEHNDLLPHNLLLYICIIYLGIYAKLVCICYSVVASVNHCVALLYSTLTTTGNQIMNKFSYNANAIRGNMRL